MINLTWDYAAAPIAMNFYPKEEVQNDWNQTLITAINHITANIICAQMHNTNHIIVPIRFRSIFLSMVYYEMITQNLGVLGKRYSVEFTEEDNNYINVCGVPLKILNFIK